jgi:hypothetical protein
LLGAMVVVALALTLPEPARNQAPVVGPRLAVPTWSGPEPVNSAGTLADGAAYTPRVYLTAETSAGVAASPDGSFHRVLLRSPGERVTELRRVAAAELPQFDGFAADDDTLVWAESVSGAGAPVRTTLWRSAWRAGGKATQITADTGEATFFGGAYDLVVRAGRVWWVSAAPDNVTEIRSVALGGGPMAIKRLNGQYVLTAAPWAVSLGGGRGTPVELVNLDSDQRVKVPTNAAEIATCGPIWCRMAVVGEADALVRLDLQRPDGSQRRRIAGNEATPTIAEVALLDRFVPLKIDAGSAPGAADLSLVDVASGRTDLVATGVANVQGRDGVLWWSTGAGADLVWHAIDLRTLS